MRKISKRVYIILITALLLALPLAACGDPTPASAPTPSDWAAPPMSPAPSPTPSPTPIPSPSPADTPTSSPSEPPPPPPPTESPAPSPGARTYEYVVNGGSGNTSIAHIIAVIDAADQRAEYTVIEPDGTNHIVDIQWDAGTRSYTMLLLTEEGETMETIPHAATAFDFSDQSGDSSLKFIDANADGYADIQLYTGGADNGGYDIYLWDTATATFLAASQMG